MADKQDVPAMSPIPMAPILAPKSEQKPPLPVPKLAAPQGNPAFRAMGLPSWRPKLPSRNWMIFFTVIGSWTGALVYDRQMKKKEQQKWCRLVSHIAQETLPSNTLPRKVTVYLAAPPGDGLRVAREHFTEYVKPVLVAGGLDWDVIEGRREGEVRAGLADRIRKMRRRKGETAEGPAPDDANVVMEALRERMGVQEYEGQKGDVIVGRHAWKEYIRGLHEGWLGPLDAPSLSVVNNADTAAAAEPALLTTPELTPLPAEGKDDVSPASGNPVVTQEPEKPKEPPAPEKPAVTPPYNSPASYSSSPTPPAFPSELPASNPIPFPHILGFRNTPIRIYRFLTRRYIADNVGRQTAAVVLATYRPYTQSAPTANSSSELSTETMSSSDRGSRWEQQSMLGHEEADWWGKALKRTEGDGEREWLDDMMVDERIGERMRRFELEPEDEERARRIRQGIAGIPGRGHDES